MRALRRNAAPTAKDLFDVAADAWREAEMVRGDKAKKKMLKAQAKEVYDEAVKLFPNAFVPPSLQHFKYTGKVTIDELAEALGLTSWDKLDDMNFDYYWQAAQDAVDEDDFVDDPDGYENAQQEAEGRVRDELFRQWHGAVEATVDNLFREYAELGVEGIRPRGKGVPKDALPYEYAVVPVKDWNSSADQLVDVINGYGSFYIQTVKDFIDSGPYANAKIAVLSHLHWIARGPAVYGGTSAQRFYETAMR